MTAKVAAVLLAAGASRRLGYAKQLLTQGTRPWVYDVATRLLSTSAHGVSVVVGCGADRVQAALEGLPVHLVPNPRWREGQGTSVSAGVEALAVARTASGVEGALFVPCDQPFLTASTIDLLIDRFRRNPSRVIRPRYAGHPGAPVIFPASLFPELLELEADEGGRSVLRRHQDKVLDVPIDDPREGIDIDTPEDAARYGFTLPSGEDLSA